MAEMINAGDVLEGHEKTTCTDGVEQLLFHAVLNAKHLITAASYGKRVRFRLSRSFEWNDEAII